MADRVRFIGGPLNGQSVWIDQDRTLLTVQVAQSGDLPRHTLQYRREGTMMVFVDPATPETTPPEGT